MMLLALVFVLPSCGKDDPEPTPEPTPEPKTCDVTFWTDDDDCIQEIEVNLWAYDYDYDKYRYITKYYESTPDCGDEWCANFYDVEPGDYYYWAENDYYEWEGDLKVESSCHTIKLYVSKARAKVSAIPSDAPKMERAEMNFDMNYILNK